MRWRVVRDTLIVEGDFFAISSGVLGGWGRVEHLFNHTIRGWFDDPKEYVKRIANEFGLKRFFGLLTAVPMDKLPVVSVGNVTAFVTAGITNPNERIGTINVIIVVDGEMPESAMINVVITATEAKSFALLKAGLNFTGTSTDAVIVAKTCKGDYYEYAGYVSELGRRIWEAVKRGVTESLSKWKSLDSQHG